MRISTVAGQMYIRRSPKQDSICDITLMEKGANSGLKASLSREQCERMYNLLRYFLYSSEVK